MIKISNIAHKFLNLSFWKKAGVVSLVLLFAACSVTEYEGDKELLATKDSTAIFIGATPKATTRAAGLETREGSMKVYAAKKFTSQFEKAIGNYVVWNTSQNPAVSGEWEYVGEKGETKSIIKEGQAATTGNFTLPQKQVKKYWDYKSSQYIFWAVAPYTDNVTFNVSTADDVTKGTVTSATVTGIGGHLTANDTTTPNKYTEFYLARPVIVKKNDYGKKNANNPVQFNFDHMHAKVRVGIYETIPSYKVMDITFYNNDDTPVGGPNIVFNREDETFVGGNGGTATITYNNTTPEYSIAYEGLTTQKWVQFGKLGELADPSDYTYMLKLWGTDGDMSVLTSFYFDVLPTPTDKVNSDKPITMKMDITLQSEDAAEEKIKVKGVTATVPLSYSTWKPNHAYTYVFKITRAALDLNEIEFDAEASGISESTTTGHDLE